MYSHMYEQLLFVNLKIDCRQIIRTVPTFTQKSANRLYILRRIRYVHTHRVNLLIQTDCR